MLNSDKIFKIKQCCLTSTKEQYQKSIWQVMYLCLLVFMISACAPKLSFQIKQPSVQNVKNIEYIAVGDFQAIEGKILITQQSKHAFDASEVSGQQTADLLRAMLVHELSLSSPYRLINTTGEESGFSGVLPNPSKVAVLSAKVKYYEERVESQEKLPYLLNVENRSVRLEEAFLAAAVSYGAESSGAGFKVETPFVELFAAIEVEFRLRRQSDGSNVIPPQKFDSFFLRKWGGDERTSYLPSKVRSIIINNQSQDEKYVNLLLSEMERGSLLLVNPEQFYAKGYHLNQNSRVPLTSLDLKIRLGKDTTQQYIKQISPHDVTTDLNVMSGGNTAASTLIKGNAYEEAIAQLQNLKKRSFEDEYNLGLAYEANGEYALAKKHYLHAKDQDQGNSLIEAALMRVN